MLFRLAALPLIFALTAAVGCSSGPVTVPVSGKVTLDGQPLADANVTLMPVSGKFAMGKTDAGGNFTLKYEEQDLPPGKYRVAVSKSRVTNVGVGKDGVSEPVLPGGPMVVWDAPEKYSRPDTSELTATVEPGMAPLLFELKSK